MSRFLFLRLQPLDKGALLWFQKCLLPSCALSYCPLACLLMCLLFPVRWTDGSENHGYDLTIMRRIVERHAGLIDYFAHDAVFQLVLPLRQKAI